jgi:hypothetical protein
MLFNNCRSRPHAELYGSNAFYDLDQFGAQANMATELEPGQHCCVATLTENKDIQFGWFCFREERLLPDPDEPNSRVRVLFGEWLGSEILTRAQAIATEPYAQFFNVNSHFKRLSAIRPIGDCITPAGLVRD